MAADLHLVQDAHGYRDVEIYIADGESEWLYRVYLDKSSGEIVRCEPRFAANKGADFGDDGERNPPEHVSAEMDRVYSHVAIMLNDTSICVGTERRV